MQWQGKCNVCGNWNTLKEFKVSQQASSRARSGEQVDLQPQPLASVSREKSERQPSGFGEVDRVLGGGIVPGSVILVGGDPGIGKSTLLLQVAAQVAAQSTVLYISGEESPAQIKLRADRLGLQTEPLELLCQTNINQIATILETKKYGLVIIDSIQTMYDPEFPSTPGSIVQVRECAIRFQQIAKQLQISIVLVGHITKEGTVAGPRMLEHLVDVVLYLEGESQHDLRVLRAVKNRFGDAAEVGLFTMQETGLIEVANPSLLLLEGRSLAAGSVLTMVMEGSRPVLVEVQALTVPTVFGNPRRTASGFDLNRLNLLLAVLQRRAGIDLSNYDVYINIVGGLRVKDPGVDLAVCMALTSAQADQVVDEKLVCVGEVGLGGELRNVSQQERRQKEATQLGYRLLLSNKMELRQYLAKAVHRQSKGQP